MVDITFGDIKSLVSENQDTVRYQDDERNWDLIFFTTLARLGFLVINKGIKGRNSTPAYQFFS